MERNVMKIRMLAAAAAVAIVAGAILSLGSYSNAKFAIAATAAQPYAAEQADFQPSRIDVVATRVARARTTAHVNEASVGRPQS
jgi:hypothetical protein